MSCFEGRIKELKNVSIDCFENSNIYSTAYFLSHCHTDHMKGLRSCVFLNRLGSEACVYLYCSEITAHILTAQTSFAALLHKIKVLPLGVSTIVKIQDPDGSVEEVTVSLIPTGHCPGAVMFLFEGEMEKILYTGDFRLCEGDVPRFRQLHHSDGSVKVIDKLYLDTTFLSHQYMQFPSRLSSISILCSLITSWLQEGSDNAICIQMPANYGSEAVFIAVAKHLRMKICVSSDAYNIYKNIAEIQEAVTDDPSCTRIHACRQRDRHVPSQGRLSKLRIIKPCALSFTSKVYNGSLESAVLKNNDQELFRICYSSHCSYRELEDFIRYLKPRQIEACVVPRNMKEADILWLLKEISRWGDDFTEAPVLTVSGNKGTENGVLTDMTSVCSKRLTEQENTSTSDSETDVNKAYGGNVQNEGHCVNPEIYRLIAEDFKPKIGDSDMDIRQNISLEFLENAAGKTSVW